MPPAPRRTLLADAARRLRAAGIAAPEREARLLLRWASGLPAAVLGARLDEEAGPGEAERMDHGVAQRAGRRPLSHITGCRTFWGRDFTVTPDVLDPRPETEALVAAALERPFERGLDLGTGSGCLLLTLLAECPRATGLGTDASAAALAVARTNALRLRLADRADFLEADWLDGVTGPFDLVVSNPPYISEAEISGLAPEVRDHEPRSALTPGGDGLAAYRAIAAGAGRVLAPGGRLLLEIGPTQAGAVGAILNRCGFRVAAPMPDLDGRDRVLAAMAEENRPGEPFRG